MIVVWTTRPGQNASLTVIPGIAGKQGAHESPAPAVAHLTWSQTGVQTLAVVVHLPVVFTFWKYPLKIYVTHSVMINLCSQFKLLFKQESV